jgi:hypothetical protein
MAVMARRTRACTRAVASSADSGGTHGLLRQVEALGAVRRSPQRRRRHEAGPPPQGRVGKPPGHGQPLVDERPLLRGPVDVVALAGQHEQHAAAQLAVGRRQPAQRVLQRPDDALVHDAVRRGVQSIPWVVVMAAAATRSTSPSRCASSIAASSASRTASTSPAQRHACARAISRS